MSTSKVVSLGFKSRNRHLVESWWNRQSYFELIKAQCEVQDLGKLLGQRLLPLQVLSGVVVGLAGQSSQEATQRRFCEKEKSDICVRGAAASEGECENISTIRGKLMSYESVRAQMASYRLEHKWPTRVELGQAQVR